MNSRLHIKYLRYQATLIPKPLKINKIWMNSVQSFFWWKIFVWELFSWVFLLEWNYEVVAKILTYFINIYLYIIWIYLFEKIDWIFTVFLWNFKFLLFIFFIFCFYFLFFHFFYLFLVYFYLIFSTQAQQLLCAKLFDQYLHSEWDISIFDFSLSLRSSYFCSK